MSCVTVNVPWAPAPLACMRRSGITSRWKCASFSISQTSCSKAGPRGPAVCMFRLSVTGAPEAWVRNGLLVVSFIGSSCWIGSWAVAAGAARATPAENSCCNGLRLATSFRALVEDGPDEVETGPGREQRGDPGRIVRGRHLDKISADHLETPGYFAQKVFGFVIGEAAMADCRGARGDRGVEAVDIDRDINAFAIRYVRKRRFRTDRAKLPQRDHVGPIGLRRLIVPLADRGHVVRPERRDALHVRHFGCAAHRTTVSPGDAVALVDEIEMRVEMHDVDWLLVGIGCDRRHGDRVVAAKNVWHRLGIEQRAYGQFGVRQAALGIRVDDVAVAGIDDLDLFRSEIGHLVLEIEDAFRAKTVEHRHFADRARPKAGSNAITRGRIDRDTQNGNIGAIELVPVGAGRLARKGRQSNKGQIHSYRHVPAYRLCVHCNLLVQ